MKPMANLVIFACAGLLVGCAASIPPPPQLIYARQAYARWSASPAAQLVSADVRKARAALAEAEESFCDNPLSYRTQRLTNLAFHEAKRLEALVTSSADNAATAKSNRYPQSDKTQILMINEKVDDPGRKGVLIDR